MHIDCKDAYQNGHTTSGVYTINPDNQTEFKVYCDMDTDGGGWTVIQRRFDGSVTFDRNWAECESGFGNKTGEYWLGLSYIHRLTTSASQDLRVDLEDFEGGTAYTRYTTFTVANAANSYTEWEYQDILVQLVMAWVLTLDESSQQEIVIVIAGLVVTVQHCTKVHGGTVIVLCKPKW